MNVTTHVIIPSRSVQWLSDNNNHHTNEIERKAKVRMRIRPNDESPHDEDSVLEIAGTLEGVQHAIRQTMEIFQNKTEKHPFSPQDQVLFNDKVEITIPSSFATILMAQNGKILQEIGKETMARFQVTPVENMHLGSTTRLLYVRGTANSQKAAVGLVMNQLKTYRQLPSTERQDETTLKLMIAQYSMKHLTPDVLNGIMHATSVVIKKFDLDGMESIVTISGTMHNVFHAQSAIIRGLVSNRSAATNKPNQTNTQNGPARLVQFERRRSAPEVQQTGSSSTNSSGRIVRIPSESRVRSRSHDRSTSNHRNVRQINNGREPKRMKPNQPDNQVEATAPSRTFTWSSRSDADASYDVNKPSRRVSIAHTNTQPDEEAPKATLVPAGDSSRQIDPRTRSVSSSSQIRETSGLPSQTVTKPSLASSGTSKPSDPRFRRGPQGNRNADTTLNSPAIELPNDELDPNVEKSINAGPTAPRTRVPGQQSDNLSHATPSTEGAIIQNSSAPTKQTNSNLVDPRRQPISRPVLPTTQSTQLITVAEKVAIKSERAQAPLPSQQNSVITVSNSSDVSKKAPTDPRAPTQNSLTRVTPPVVHTTSKLTNEQTISYSTKVTSKPIDPRTRNPNSTDPSTSNITPTDVNTIDPIANARKLAAEYSELIKAGYLKSSDPRNSTKPSTARSPQTKVELPNSKADTSSVKSTSPFLCTTGTSEKSDPRAKDQLSTLRSSRSTNTLDLETNAPYIKATIFKVPTDPRIRRSVPTTSNATTTSLVDPPLCQPQTTQSGNLQDHQKNSIPLPHPISAKPSAMKPSYPRNQVAESMVNLNLNSVRSVQSTVSEPLPDESENYETLKSEVKEENPTKTEPAQLSSIELEKSLESRLIPVIVESTALKPVGATKSMSSKSVVDTTEKRNSSLKSSLKCSVEEPKRNEQCLQPNSIHLSPNPSNLKTTSKDSSVDSTDSKRERSPLAKLKLNQTEQSPKSCLNAEDTDIVSRSRSSAQSITIDLTTSTLVPSLESTIKRSTSSVSVEKGEKNQRNEQGTSVTRNTSYNSPIVIDSSPESSPVRIVDRSRRFLFHKDANGDDENTQFVPIGKATNITKEGLGSNAKTAMGRNESNTINKLQLMNSRGKQLTGDKSIKTASHDDLPSTPLKKQKYVHTSLPKHSKNSPITIAVTSATQGKKKGQLFENYAIDSPMDISPVQSPEKNTRVSTREQQLHDSAEMKSMKAVESTGAIVDTLKPVQTTSTSNLSSEAPKQSQDLVTKPSSHDDGIPTIQSIVPQSNTISMRSSMQTTIDMSTMLQTQVDIRIPARIGLELLGGNGLGLFEISRMTNTIVRSQFNGQDSNTMIISIFGDLQAVIHAQHEISIRSQLTKKYSTKSIM